MRARASTLSSLVPRPACLSCFASVLRPFLGAQLGCGCSAALLAALASADLCGGFWLLGFGGFLDDPVSHLV